MGLRADWADADGVCRRRLLLLPLHSPLLGSSNYYPATAVAAAAVVLLPNSPALLGAVD